MRLSDVVLSHRLIVCVGAGGVGKTTVAAALALGAAARGRRAAVLTVDPARALCRALGLEELGSEPERIVDAESSGGAVKGSFDAAMLDRERAWDGLIHRYAPSPAVERAVLSNHFYRELARDFAGGAEYAAMEEVGCLVESGRWDLIVLDTPPSVRAFDFVTAPDRIERLFHPELARWLLQPTRTLGRGAARATGATVRLLVRRLERAAGKRTLGEIADFFSALGEMVEQLRARSRRARSLARSPESAFVLVTGAHRQVLDQTETLVERMRALEVPLRGVVFNRLHPALGGQHPERAVRDVAALLSGPALAGHPTAVLAWLGRVHREACQLSELEMAHVAEFARRFSPELAKAMVGELERDLHTLDDLAQLAAELFDPQADSVAFRDPRSVC